MIRHFLSAVALSVMISFYAKSQVGNDTLFYSLSIRNPQIHSYEVSLRLRSSQDTLRLLMPNWTPGYYRMMNYANAVNRLSAFDVINGDEVKVLHEPSHVWTLCGVKEKSLEVKYEIMTTRPFVANSYVDKFHAYILGANTFLYPEATSITPVKVEVHLPESWTIATGLTTDSVNTHLFSATDFDMLYDCPMLMGNLEELPTFYVHGVKHRFVGYQLGDFDKVSFMNKLERLVSASVNIIGDIPLDSYSFIAIGPGRGGIEHLNTTTISFDGSSLNEPEGMDKMLKFLAHEYFHHYNVKRIRPFELGPFDYEKGSKTNLLWVSEGLTVYYEYLILVRAELIGRSSFLSNLEYEINTLENNPGRYFQSLKQASYSTWQDGPFGQTEAGRSISVYNKGAVIGLILDLAIRYATQNRKSLDDVMRQAYYTYYKVLNRGFTDAEFEQLCEEIAQSSLSEVFEYVYSTKEIDYARYLNYAGLKIKLDADSQNFRIEMMENPDAQQSAILSSLMGNP